VLHLVYESTALNKQLERTVILVTSAPQVRHFTMHMRGCSTAALGACLEVSCFRRISKFHAIKAASMCRSFTVS
jgi:hypothetical protein